MKNLEFAAVLPFAQQVQYQKGQVVSKTIAQSKALSLTLLHLIREKKSAPMLPMEMLWSSYWTDKAKLPLTILLIF